MFGIPFILLGNLAGNALALARYIMLAAGYSNATDKLTASKGSVVGIAIGALTLIMFIHMSSRRGGIILNDLFAIFKVLLLLAVVVIGFIFRGDGLPQKDLLGGQNYEAPNAFADRTKSVWGYTQSLLVVLFSYSGYEQPFYVSDQS
jgi:amino acid permease